MLEGRFGDMAELLGGARRAAARWRGARSGRLLHAARRSRARLLVRARRSAGHAHVGRGDHCRRGGQPRRSRHLDRDLAALRRGACRPAYRQGDRPAPGAPAARAHARARRARRQRGRRAPGPHRSGNAHLPGAAHPRQRRAGRARARTACRRGAARAGRPAGGGRVPFPGRSHRQTLLRGAQRRRAAPIAPPADGRDGSRAAMAAPSQASVRPGPAEIEANPRARSARLRWAERLAAPEPLS